MGEKSPSKNPFANLIRSSTKKRKPSSGKESETKRERLNLDTDESSSSESMAERTTFIDNFKAALEVKEIQELMNKRLKKDVEEIKKQVSEIKSHSAKTNQRIDVMENKFEDLDQQEKDNNIMISGLADDETSVTKICEILTVKLKFEVTEADIRYTYTLKQNEQHDAQNKCKVRVVFKTKEMKDKVYKRKKILQGTDLWIGDDLTPSRRRLFYMARQAVKNNEAIRTWTVDGKIFLKIADTDRPIRIKTSADMPGANASTSNS